MRAALLALAAVAGALPALARGSILAFPSVARRSMPEVPSAPLVEIQAMASALAAAPSSCSDAFLLIEFDEFHAHTLASRPADDAVKQHVLAAEGLVGAAHVTGPAPLSTELARALDSKCGAQTWAHVSASDLPLLGGVAALPSKLVRLEADLASESDAVSQAMQAFAEVHPQGVVLLASRTHGAGAQKRSLAPLPRAATQQRPHRSQPATFVSQYQFFTSELLLAAIVVLTLFVPVVWVFIKLLADIQTPDRLGEKSALTQMAKKAQ